MSNFYICTDTWVYKKLIGKQFPTLRKELEYQGSNPKIYLINGEDLMLFYQGLAEDTDAAKQRKENTIRKYLKYRLPKHFCPAEEHKVYLLTHGKYVNEYLMLNYERYSDVLDRVDYIYNLKSQPNNLYIDDEHIGPTIPHQEYYKIPTKHVHNYMTGVDKFGRPIMRPRLQMTWHYKQKLTWELQDKAELLENIASAYLHFVVFQKKSTIPQSGFILDSELEDRQDLRYGLSLIDAVPTAYNILPMSASEDSTARLGSESHETKADPTGKLYKKPSSGYSIMQRQGALVDLGDLNEYWNTVLDSDYVQILNPNVIICKCGTFRQLNTPCPECFHWHWTETIRFARKNPSIDLAYMTLLEKMSALGQKFPNKTCEMLAKQYCTMPPKVDKIGNKSDEHYDDSYEYIDPVHEADEEDNEAIDISDINTIED